ncbi:hypothetical protein AB0B45_14610 [Nonomuraea sp. NPDC049152]|uniref:hypothetical protein n=1 Tax=Nonomuraea sp. NPDC049152 TaxID=3154350 RepID=UPI0033F80F5B
MKLSTLVCVAVAALLTGGCGASSAQSATSAQSREAASPLLSPEQLGGGRTWTATETREMRWVELAPELVPCGRRVIAPEGAHTLVRSFGADDGSSVSQLVATGIEAMDAFKRFHAECGAVGTVESAAGPAHIARANGRVAIAATAGDSFVVIGGTAPEADLIRIAETARKHALANPS